MTLKRTVEIYYFLRRKLIDADFMVCVRVSSSDLHLYLFANMILRCV